MGESWSGRLCCRWERLDLVFTSVLVSLGEAYGRKAWAESTEKHGLFSGTWGVENSVLPEARGKEEPQAVFHILFLVPMSAACAAHATSSVAGSKPTACRRSPESQRATLESQGLVCS